VSCLFQVDPSDPLYVINAGLFFIRLRRFEPNVDEVIEHVFDFEVAAVAPLFE
jgi:hypothetical protein